jgi:pilus assembly protein CpaB
MRNWKAILPVVIAVVIAAAGTYYIYTWTHSQTLNQEVSMGDVQAIPVAVANVDLAWGTKLTPEMVKLTPFIKESLPQGYFGKKEDLQGRVLLAPMKMGDPIVEHRLAPLDIKTGGVAAVLQQGKRALSVKGDKVIGISGFINPGNRVDVVLTVTDPDRELEISKIILQDVPVLATGTQIQKNEKGEPSPVDVYTLELTPEDAEKLALAASEGKLQFALRNAMDTEAVSTPGATVAQTLSGLTLTAAPLPAAPVQMVQKPVRKRVVVDRSMNVEVIRGTSVTNEKHKL